MAGTGSLERIVEVEEDEEDEAWPGLLEPMQRESPSWGPHRWGVGGVRARVRWKGSKLTAYYGLRGDLTCHDYN